MKNLLSSTILIGMGIYGIVLYSQNKLGLYIHPRFFEESLLASIVALLVGTIAFIYFILKSRTELTKLKSIINARVIILITLVFLSFFNSVFILFAILTVFAPNKDFNKFFKNDVWGTVLVISIVLIGIIFPAKGLSSLTASQRSVDLNSINLTQSTMSVVDNFSKSTSNYTLGDWIALIGYNPDPEFYKGKDVKISGFMYQPESLHLESNTALIARFIITCCAVDARPVGLKYVIPQDSNIKTDDWIEITGKFDLNNNGEIIIKSDEIKKIDPPSNPYIF